MEKHEVFWPCLSEVEAPPESVVVLVEVDSRGFVTGGQFASVLIIVVGAIQLKNVSPEGEKECKIEPRWVISRPWDGVVEDDCFVSGLLSLLFLSRFRGASLHSDVSIILHGEVLTETIRDERDVSEEA